MDKLKKYNYKCILLSQVGSDAFVVISEEEAVAVMLSSGRWELIYTNHSEPENVLVGWHRLDGPAYINAGGDASYYVNNYGMQSYELYDEVVQAYIEKKEKEESDTQV